MWKVPNLKGNYVYTKPSFIAILHCCYSCYCHIVTKNKTQKTGELLKNMGDVEEVIIRSP